MKPDATRDRRRFRFSLRMLFVLVTVICLWLSWNAHTVNARREMLAEIESRGGTVLGWFAIDEGQLFTFPESSEWPPQYSRVLTIDTTGPVSSIRRLMGDRAVEVIYLPSQEFSSLDGERIQAAIPEALLLPGPFGMSAASVSETYN